MGKRMGLLLMVVGIPAFGFWAANGCQDLLDSQLRDAMRKEYSTVGEERISSVSLASLCERPRFGDQDLCTTFGTLQLMKEASLASGGAGLALLVLIWGAGRIARNRRRLLLYVFKPGLYLTALVLIGLVITYAAIAMGAIYYGESLLVGRVHVFLIGAIGLGAFGGVGAIATNALRVVQKAKTTAVGTPVSRNETPALWETVEELADELGSLLPDHIVLGMDPNFYVTEAKVTSLGGDLSGRTMYCSVPLLRILEKDEARAILAHELAHFEGEDTRYSQQFYPIYRGSYSAINSLLETGGESFRMLALLPAVAIFRFFINAFASAERKIGRERELRADAEAAALCGSSALGTGLVKIHAFTPAWPVVQETSADLLRSGRMLQNMSESFAQTVRQAAGPNVLDGVADEQMTHPTDTHPPLSKRLESLDLEMDQLGDAALGVPPTDPAFDFVTGLEEKEESLSAAYQMVLARGLGIDIQTDNE